MKFLSNDKGLTLLEILIASGLMAFIAMGVVTMTDDAFNKKDSITLEDNEYLQVELFFSRFKKDLLQIYSPLNYAPMGQKEKINAWDKSVLQKNDQFYAFTYLGQLIPTSRGENKHIISFFTFGNQRKFLDQKESNYQWVQYSTEDNEEGNLKSIQRRTSSDNPYHPSRVPWDDIKAQTILTNVKKIEYSFWNDEKKEFQSAPIDFTQWKVSLKAVKVDLIWEDIYGYKNEDTRVFRVFWPEYQWNDKELEIWKKKE